MRLCLYGGTFDPIHLGHLVVAETVREACALDEIWFVVAREPPHKPGERTPADHRLEMARIAIAGHPSFDVSEHDIKRPGPHYSADLLEIVGRERPDDELFFLIGADSLADLPNWRRPERILELATVIAVNRLGVEPILPPRLEPMLARPGSKPILHIETPIIELASRDLRARVAGGRSIRYLVPRGVEAYIEAQRLYRSR